MRTEAPRIPNKYNRQRRATWMLSSIILLMNVPAAFAATTVRVEGNGSENNTEEIQQAFLVGIVAANNSASFFQLRGNDIRRSSVSGVEVFQDYEPGVGPPTPVQAPSKWVIERNTIVSEGGFISGTTMSCRSIEPEPRGTLIIGIPGMT